MTDSSQYIHRTLEKSVRTAAQTFPVVVVSGTRRVGKTELLRRLDPKRPGVRLESYSLPEFDREKPADFWRVFPPPVRIDGTRRFPRLPEALKLLTDGTPAAGAVFLSVPQTQAVGPMAEALPGRLAAFELLPLSLYETEGFAFDQKPYVPQADLVKPKLPEMLPEVLWHRIWHGQFPEIVNAEDEERHALFNDLFRRFTEVDAFGYV